jgi:hypothetical protein
MKRILGISALALGVFFAGSAAAEPQGPPGFEARPVNENACEHTDPLWTDAPGSARAGLPHDQGHVHEGEELGCHHATGTEDPNPNP